jgi:hypothetical protein
MSTPLKLNAIISDDPSKEKFLGHQTISIENFLSQYSNHNNLSSKKNNHTFYQQPGIINQRNK